MTIYERMQKIHETYCSNADACESEGLLSASRILMASADMLDDYIERMPVHIAGMYAGENE